MTSPKAGWTYYEDTKILLAANVDTNDIIWSSSLCGYLGKGNHLAVFLPAGTHGIDAEIGGIKKEQIIRVFPGSGTSDNTRAVLVNYTPLDIKLKAGTYYPCLLSQEGSISGVTVSALPVMQTATESRLQAAVRQAVTQEPLVSGQNFCRDIRLPLPRQVQPVRGGMSRMALSSRASSNSTQRSFFVVNTANQYGPPHEIEAELFFQSDALSVWLPVSCPVQAEALRECIQTVERRILPRIESLWGKAADIDEDGRFALLVTPSINDEKAAIGFFNPADFFKRNTDEQSAAYNPASNEMDIIYIAVPDSTPGSSYSPESIIATIAHELTHAVTFTTKTWSRVSNGNEYAAREELFLDEGLSHLTENLCGYGGSGGNIKFLNRFFDDTSAYSFCGVNRYGQEDSAGMRGAITLFLSWLFWKAGGMAWDRDNPVALIDTGGIAFLKCLAASPGTGWENIGKIYGKPVETLFREMVSEINGARSTGSIYQYKQDPLTNEPVEFFMNMGIVNGINVGFPKSSAYNSSNALGPWTFMLFEPYCILEESLNTIHALKYSGAVYYTVWRRSGD